MVLFITAIKDSKVGTFGPPMTTRSLGEAEREFHGAANNDQSKICIYPKDYDLWHIASFDDATGKITPLDSPVHIVAATQLKNLGEKLN